MPRAAAKAKDQPETLADAIVTPPIAAPDAAAQAAGDVAAIEIALHLIDENPENPRSAPTTKDDEEADAELTASIGKDGVLQPIMVRPNPAEPDRFLVVMGSRRLRCSKAAGKFTIPAVVRDVDLAKAFEIASIENLQRQDMNPIDEAKAFKRILDDRLAGDQTLKLKEAKQVIAEATGKTTRFVELRLQLLKLPAIKQIEVQQGKTSAKEAILYARHNLPPELPAGRLLLIAEIAVACAGKGKLQPNKSTPIGGANRDDKDLQAIRSLNLFWTTKDYNNGADSIAIQQRGLDTLAEADQAFFTDARAALQRMQATTLTEKAWNAHVSSGKAFVTPWLNEPFDLHPEEVARNAQRIEAQATRKASDEQRERERAKRDRDFGREGQKALARVLQLEDDAPGMDDATFAEAFRTVAQANGWTLPLRIVWLPPGGDHYDRGDTILVDDAGEQVMAGYGALEAIRRLYAVAVNRVSGFASTAGPPIAESRWAKDAAAGLYDAQDDDSDDDEGGAPPSEQGVEPDVDDAAEPFADDATAEDDEDQDEEASAGDDETPEFLLRLVGGGDQAEARS